MKAPLHPHEIAKRHQAVMDAYFKNSRAALVARADAGPAAGANSAPVGPNTLGCASMNCTAGLAAGGAFLAGVHTVVSYATAQGWAISQGLCKRGQPLDLRAANELRRKLGAPPFALKDGAA